jgi:hypothetical protein
MITNSTYAASYLRPVETQRSMTTLTPADALPATESDASEVKVPAKQGIPVSNLRKLNVELKAVSIDDIPELRDLLATMWLDTQAHEARMATEVPDNAPQNTYATVKVNGEVVATLYNGGSVAMTNAAAAMAGDLPNYPNGGPDLAQTRAEYIAKMTGGTIEKASTAITQSLWTPRESISTNYTRAQLDDAFQAWKADSQKAAAQRLAGYSAPQERSGFRADFNV